MIRIAGLGVALIHRVYARILQSVHDALDLKTAIEVSAGVSMTNAFGCRTNMPH